MKERKVTQECYKTNEVKRQMIKLKNSQRNNKETITKVDFKRLFPDVAETILDELFDYCNVPPAAKNK